MDDEIFDDGYRRLKVSIAGVDPKTGTSSAEKFRLTLYAFDWHSSVEPRFTQVLDAEGAARLCAFLSSISLVRDRARTVSGRFVEIEEGLPLSLLEVLQGHPDLLRQPEVVRSVLQLNPDLCRTILENELIAVDIQSLAYRREQLEIMNCLLHDPEYFARYQERIDARGKEAVWQYFFEANQWIFGFALHYVIGEGVQHDKLEQTVAGHSVGAVGKRVDALLQTRGILHSLCYVEIKTHETPLVHHAQYRPDVWRPSDDLVGAVAQSQKTVQLAVEHLSRVLRLPAEESRLVEAKFFNYAPRAIVICGSLGQFGSNEGIDIPKFSSFELYRRSVLSPDIVTFDELYDRARAIVEAKLAAREASSPAT